LDLGVGNLASKSVEAGLELAGGLSYIKFMQSEAQHLIELQILQKIEML
jgi:hypothetical protein